MEIAEDLLGTLRQDGEINLGVADLHGIGQRCHHRQGRRNDAKHQPADKFTLAVSDLSQFLLKRLPVVDNEMRPFEDPFTFRCQAEETLAAFHDGYAQFLFELADAAGERWLGDIAGLGGPREVFFASKSDELLKLTDIHLTTITYAAAPGISKNKNPKCGK